MTRPEFEKLRDDFPLLLQGEGRPRVVYLDTASTAQEPRTVIDAVSRFSSEDRATVHRSVHALGERATRAHELARAKMQCFLGARETREVVFVRSATEAINLVARTYGRMHIHKGDEVLITAIEHHSNIVPWQVLCEEAGARLRVAPVTERGEVPLEEIESLLAGGRIKLVAVAHVSNALGTVLPVRRITEMARQAGAAVLVDGAQAVSHLPVDVKELGCDFYALSGHKLYGPSGVGVLYGRAELLGAMPPYQTGGEMIRSVSFARAEYAEAPQRFEAGTPNIEGAVGLGVAIDYVSAIGMKAIHEHEAAVLAYAEARMAELPGLRILGRAPERAGVLSFSVEGIHPHDLATILDQAGIAIRAGHLCAQPLLAFFGIPAAARASLGLYNTREDIDALVEGVRKAIDVFS